MTDEQLDVHLDNILKASGSALKHYSMQKTKDDMRQALRQALPKRKLAGLTWEEIDECFKITPDQYLPAQIYRRIEVKLKEKNT